MTKQEQIKYLELVIKINSGKPEYRLDNMAFFGIAKKMGCPSNGDSIKGKLHWEFHISESETLILEFDLIPDPTYQWRNILINGVVLVA